MDPLQPLSIKEWPLLKELFKRDWPNYAQYYHWIDNAIKWNKKDPNCTRKIYCPNGKYHYGIFIGILSGTVCTISVAAFDKYQDLLKKVLIETNLVDWNQTIKFSFIHEYVKGTFLEALNELNELKGVHINDIYDADLYFKSKEECAKLIIKVPEECELRHLNSSHIPLVQSFWPHSLKDHTETTAKFLESLVTLNRGMGLFLKTDDSLVSWILENEYGLGILQTVNEHKRKGYGKIVTEAIAKEIALKENLDSVVYIMKGNVASEKLFTSLGYKRFTSASWIMAGKIN